MSNESNPPMDPRTRVRMTSRLWSSEVAMAEADLNANCQSLKELRGVAYRFSGGREFVNKQNPYDPPAE